MSDEYCPDDDPADLTDPADDAFERGDYFLLWNTDERRDLPVISHDSWVNIAKARALAAKQKKPAARATSLHRKFGC